MSNYYCEKCAKKYGVKYKPFSKGQCSYCKEYANCCNPSLDKDSKG